MTFPVFLSVMLEPQYYFQFNPGLEFLTITLRYDRRSLCICGIQAKTMPVVDPGVTQGAARPHSQKKIFSTQPQNIPPHRTPIDTDDRERTVNMFIVNAQHRDTYKLLRLQLK
jgi:hypothetical protein